VSGALITHRILEQVELMIVLRIEPFPGLDDLSGDLRPLGVKVFLLHLLSHSLGDVFLRRRVVKDGGAILWKAVALKFDEKICGEGTLTSSAVVTLPVESRRIVCAVEEF